MKNKTLVLFVLLICLNLSGQNWKYNSGTSDFDGKYRTATVVGSGGEFPYKTPLFVVNCFDNEGLNVYFSNAGYAGCDHKVAYFKFDKDDEIYQSQISTNSDKDVWFVETFVNANKSLDIIDLLEKLKKHSKFSVRLSSDCGKKDYTFSLSGSTAAIDFVYKPYIEQIEQRKLATQLEIQLKNELIQLENGLIQNEKIRFKNELDEKEIFEGIVLYPCTIYSKPDLYSQLKLRLNRGENIRVINYFNESDFYILKSAKSIQVNDDIYYYINKNDLKVFRNQNDKLKYEKELLDRLNVPFNGVVLNPEYLYSKPDGDSIWGYKTLKKHENVVVIDYSLESDYYMIKKSNSIDIPNNVFLYVKKDIIKSVE